jgi:arylsulfatase A-like enzyme
MASWENIPESQRPFQRRLMEVFAGFVEHVDAQVGRIVDGLEEMKIRDNTIIFYVFGDNGSSAEGQNGTISELLAQNMIPNTIEQQLETLDKIGGLDALGTAKPDSVYHAGWAWAGDTPFRYTKLVASHFGGTRNPLIISWPKGIKPEKTPRPQFHHVNDIAPTKEKNNAEAATKDAVAQKSLADSAATKAKRNESVALTALAVTEMVGHPIKAAKLALAAWPRDSNDYATPMLPVIPRARCRSRRA